MSGRCLKQGLLGAIIAVIPAWCQSGVAIAPSVVIDSPAAGGVITSGTVTVSGWAIDNTSLSETAISGVVVKVDGGFAGTATYGISRPDVCGAYPRRPGCPNVGYSFSLNTGGFSSGTHTISVSATDSDSTPDVGTASVVVTFMNTAVSLTSSANPATYGQPVTLTATVSAVIGVVTFYDGVSVLGVKTLVGGQASLTTGMLPAGVRSLKAYYGGGGGYAPETSAVLVENVNAVAGNGFLPGVFYAGGIFPEYIATGDFSGHGKVDLAVANFWSNTVSVFLNKGDGTFRLAVNYGVGIGPTSIAVGDFNGDGITDLAVANYWDGTISLLWGNGDGTFQASVSHVVGNSPNSVVAADFNGDGKADLAVANSADGTVSVLLGNGDGTFQAALILATGGLTRFSCRG